MAATDVKILLPRPIEVIHALPPEFRWEFTRRHPFYVGLATQFRIFPDMFEEPALGQMLTRVRAFLRLLGVTVDPPPPSASFADLMGDASISRGWLDGSIAPVTMRGMAMALTGLPPDAKALIIEALSNSMGGEDSVNQAILDLHAASHPALDSHPGEMIVGINLHAPLTAIKTAVGTLVGDAKKRRNIPETRRRFDNLSDKVEAWDLREGWTNGSYDIERELSFEQIGQTMNSPASTAFDRYREAFYLVTGFDYSFNNWCLAFMTEKLSGLGVEECLQRRRNRGASDKSDDQAVEAADEQIGADPVLETGAAFAVVTDVATLIARGFDDSHISKELDVPQNLVSYLRGRNPLIPSPQSRRRPK